MKLVDIEKHFGSSSKGFWQQFPHPLLLEEGDDPTREVYTVKGKEGCPVVLGRGIDCDVRVVHTQVSNRHAQFLPPQKTGDSWQIVDLRSTNGTLLDGELILPGDLYAIPDGAAVVLGTEVRLRFLTPESFREVLRELAKKHVPGERPKKGKTVSSGRIKVPEDLLEDDDEDRVVLDMPDGVWIYCDPFDPVPLPKDSRVIIGRQAGPADMALPHKHLSRQHLEVRRKGNRVFVRDMGSTNGTFLGGKQLGPEPVPLGLRQRMLVGPFQVYLDEVRDTTGGWTLRVDPQDAKLESTFKLYPLRRILGEVEEQEMAGTLDILSGELKGGVAFDEGKPIAAFTDQGDEGTRAIQRLLELENGRFVLRSGRESLPTEKRMIRSFSEILELGDG